MFKKIKNYSLFFYGTLRSEDVRKAVLGNLELRLKYSKAFIIGYKLFRVKNTNYPLIIYNKNFKDPIDGILVSGINSKILKKLDLFEGENYSRNKIVAFEKGEEKKIYVEIYMPNKALDYSDIWVYEDWEKKNKSNFFKTDFNINGVLKPN